MWKQISAAIITGALIIPAGGWANASEQLPGFSGNGGTSTTSQPADIVSAAHRIEPPKVRVTAGEPTKESSTFGLTITPQPTAKKPISRFMPAPPVEMPSLGSGDTLPTSAEAEALKPKIKSVENIAGKDKDGEATSTLKIEIDFPKTNPAGFDASEYQPFSTIWLREPEDGKTEKQWMSDTQDDFTCLNEGNTYTCSDLPLGMYDVVAEMSWLTGITTHTVAYSDPIRVTQPTSPGNINPEAIIIWTREKNGSSWQLAGSSYDVILSSKHPTCAVPVSASVEEITTELNVKCAGAKPGIEYEVLVQQVADAGQLGINTVAPDYTATTLVPRAGLSASPSTVTVEVQQSDVDHPVGHGQIKTEESIPGPIITYMKLNPKGTDILLSWLHMHPNESFMYSGLPDRSTCFNPDSMQTGLTDEIVHWCFPVSHLIWITEHEPANPDHVAEWEPYTQCDRPADTAGGRLHYAICRNLDPNKTYTFAVQAVFKKAGSGYMVSGPSEPVTIFGADSVMPEIEAPTGIIKLQQPSADSSTNTATESASSDDSTVTLQGTLQSPIIDSESNTKFDALSPAERLDHRVISQESSRIGTELPKAKFGPMRLMEEIAAIKSIRFDMLYASGEPVSSIMNTIGGQESLNTTNAVRLKWDGLLGGFLDPNDVAITYNTMNDQGAVTSTPKDVVLTKDRTVRTGVDGTVRCVVGETDKLWHGADIAFWLNVASLASGLIAMTLDMTNPGGFMTYGSNSLANQHELVYRLADGTTENLVTQTWTSRRELQRVVAADPTSFLRFATGRFWGDEGALESIQRIQNQVLVANQIRNLIQVPANLLPNNAPVGNLPPNNAPVGNDDPTYDSDLSSGDENLNTERDLIRATRNVQNSPSPSPPSIRRVQPDGSVVPTKIRDGDSSFGLAFSGTEPKIEADEARLTFGTTGKKKNKPFELTLIPIPYREPKAEIEEEEKKEEEPPAPRGRSVAAKNVFFPADADVSYENTEGKNASRAIDTTKHSLPQNLMLSPATKPKTDVVEDEVKRQSEQESEIIDETTANLLKHLLAGGSAQSPKPVGSSFLTSMPHTPVSNSIMSPLGRSARSFFGGNDVSLITNGMEMNKHRIRLDPKSARAAGGNGKLIYARPRDGGGGAVVSNFGNGIQVDWNSGVHGVNGIRVTLDAGYLVEATVNSIIIPEVGIRYMNSAGRIVENLLQDVRFDRIQSGVNNANSAWSTLIPLNRVLLGFRGATLTEIMEETNNEPLTISVVGQHISAAVAENLRAETQINRTTTLPMPSNFAGMPVTQQPGLQVLRGNSDQPQTMEVVNGAPVPGVFIGITDNPTSSTNFVGFRVDVNTMNGGNRSVARIGHNDALARIDDTITNTALDLGVVGAPIGTDSVARAAIRVPLTGQTQHGYIESYSISTIRRWTDVNGNIHESISRPQVITYAEIISKYNDITEKAKEAEAKAQKPEFLRMMQPQPQPQPNQLLAAPLGVSISTHYAWTVVFRLGASALSAVSMGFLPVTSIWKGKAEAIGTPVVDGTEAVCFGLTPDTNYKFTIREVAFLKNDEIELKFRTAPEDKLPIVYPLANPLKLSEADIMSSEAKPLWRETRADIGGAPAYVAQIPLLKNGDTEKWSYRVFYKNSLSSGWKMCLNYFDSVGGFQKQRDSGSIYCVPELTDISPAANGSQNKILPSDLQATMKQTKLAIQRAQINKATSSNGRSFTFNNGQTTYLMKSDGTISLSAAPDWTEISEVEVSTIKKSGNTFDLKVSWKGGTGYTAVNWAYDQTPIGPVKFDGVCVDAEGQEGAVSIVNSQSAICYGVKLANQEIMKDVIVEVSDYGSLNMGISHLPDTQIAPKRFKHTVTEITKGIERLQESVDTPAPTSTPSQPHYFDVYGLGGKLAAYEIEHSNEQLANTEMYKIQCESQKTQEKIERFTIFHSGYFEGLPEGETLECKVAAIGWNGQTSAATAAANEARILTTPGAPTDVNVEAGTNSLDISWRQPAITGGFAPGYEIQYWRQDQPTKTETKTVLAGTTKTNISGLRQGSNYSFKIKAVHHKEKVSGPYTATSTIRTKPGAPVFTETPRAAYTNNGQSITVTWNTPFDGGEPIIDYQVICRSGSKTWTEGALFWAKTRNEAAGREATQTVKENGSASYTATITGIDPGRSWYDCGVQARNSIGTSKLSFITVTKSGNPAPRDVVVDNPAIILGDRHFVVRWGSPTGNPLAHMFSQFRVYTSTDQGRSWREVKPKKLALSDNRGLQQQVDVNEGSLVRVTHIDTRGRESLFSGIAVAER